MSRASEFPLGRGRSSQNLFICSSLSLYVSPSRAAPYTLGRQVTQDSGREEVGPDILMRLAAVSQPAAL